ncbi:MAG: ankyrin repeat domain-containing protein [Chlamydiales bacterium]|nr:ankyrin repeat domain-containing protein [Chlamydiales bacterium]
MANTVSPSTSSSSLAATSAKRKRPSESDEKTQQIFKEKTKKQEAEIKSLKRRIKRLKKSKIRQEDRITALESNMEFVLASIGLKPNLMSSSQQGPFPTMIQDQTGLKMTSQLSNSQASSSGTEITSPVFTQAHNQCCNVSIALTQQPSPQAGGSGCEGSSSAYYYIPTWPAAASTPAYPAYPTYNTAGFSSPGVTTHQQQTQANSVGTGGSALGRISSWPAAASTTAYPAYPTYNTAGLSSPSVTTHQQQMQANSVEARSLAHRHIPNQLAAPFQTANSGCNAAGFSLPPITTPEQRTQANSVGTGSSVKNRAHTTYPSSNAGRRLSRQVAPPKPQESKDTKLASALKEHLQKATFDPNNNKPEPINGIRFYGTPLFYCTTLGYIQSVKVLLEDERINVNLEHLEFPCKGETPLFAASRLGYTHIVEALLQHPKIELNKGPDKGYHKKKTALDVAIESKHNAIVELLRKKMSELEDLCQTPTEIDVDSDATSCGSSPVITHLDGDISIFSTPE